MTFRVTYQPLNNPAVKFTTWVDAESNKEADRKATINASDFLAAEGEIFTKTIINLDDLNFVQDRQKFAIFLLETN